MFGLFKILIKVGSMPKLVEKVCRLASFANNRGMEQRSVYKPFIFYKFSTLDVSLREKQEKSIEEEMAKG